jgi:hypothetical protein
MQMQSAAELFGRASQIGRYLHSQNMFLRLSPAAAAWRELVFLGATVDTEIDTLMAAALTVHQ